MNSDLFSLLNGIRFGEKGIHPISEHDDIVLKNFFPDELTYTFASFGKSLYRVGLIQTCLPSDMTGTLAVIFGAE